MRRISRVIPLLTISIASPAFAETADTPPEVIVVTANREAQPLSRVGQSITVIDQKQIITAQKNVVSDFLRDVPGVTIARNGGVGGVTTVFIRGAESDQTAALIDGVKINDPSAPGGGFDFGNLLTGNIERIEVLRGASSVLWGSQAIGGVINLITENPTEDLRVNARAEGGSFGSAQVVGNVSAKVGPVSASIGGGYFRTDGISAFSAARGGTERDGYRNYGANAKFVIALSEAISIDLRGYYSNARSGIDGFAPPTFAFGDTQEVSRTRQMVGYGGINAAFFGGRFRNRIGFALTDSRARFTDASTAIPFETFAGSGRNARLEYQGVFDIAKGWQANFGAEREISRYSTSSYGFPGDPGRARITSFYGQLVATPLMGLTLTGGIRHDQHNRFGGATTLAASGVYSPNEGATTFRASYSEGFKAPTLYQLQSEYGNQLLRPERSKGYDAGITQALLGRTVEASATWFHRDSKDLINFISCPLPRTGICTGRPFGTYDNVARATAQGVELSLVLRPVDALTLRTNYSLIHAENRTPGAANFGKRLARRPGQSVNSAIDYRWSFGLSVGASVTHVASTFDNAANTAKVPGYVLADIRAGYDLSDKISLYGRIENLFDEQYETVLRYGTLGRAAYAGVRLRY
jgi:vitamin B12 transporter